MKTTEDIKVLIVEDEPIIAEDLNSFLREEGFRVAGVAHKGEEALDMLSTRNPNFAILDINLGNGISGFDIANTIRMKYHIPYIFLTSFDDETTLEEAQKFSPYGYIVKPFQERTLLTTIKLAVSNFQKINEDQITPAFLEEKFGCSITSQEFKIVESLLEGNSYKQISQQLFISLNTLKYHIKNIYTKLQIKSRSELASNLL